MGTKKSLGARTLLFPTPALVIGTYDKNGRPNAMTAAWGGISCSDPPCVSISLRKATYTYGNIMERGAFTVNVASKDMVDIVDYFGLVSGKDVNKFEATGMKPVRSRLVDAPYIDEFPLVLECEMKEAHELGLHTLFVGEIEDVKVAEELAPKAKEGLIGLINPLIYAPDDRSYYSVGKKVARGFETGKKIRGK
ncbi:MAG TPA: flavin reductase family protein [Methanomassiliicoccales archaeon]|nr:flavin reductase family protein [Methanomassiliicoccales archaeon]